MTMPDQHYYLAEARHWEYRAEEHYVIAQASRGHCRRTMLNLARRAEQMAMRAAALAVAPAVENGMQNKSGLHPYRAGLFFILREQTDSDYRTSRQAKAAMMSGNIDAIADWQMVRMLAHQFDKTARGVARDLAETFRAMEEGAPAP